MPTDTEPEALARENARLREIATFLRQLLAALIAQGGGALRLDEARVDAVPGSVEILTGREDGRLLVRARLPGQKGFLPGGEPGEVVVALRRGLPPTESGTRLALSTHAGNTVPEVVVLTDRDGRLYASGRDWDDPLDKLGADNLWSGPVRLVCEETDGQPALSGAER